MAGKIQGITVEIGGDTSKLTKSLKEVNGEIRSTEKELKEVERLLKLDPKNTELLAQKQKLLSSELDTSKKKLEALKKAKQDADQKMKSGGDVNQEMYRKLQREIVATEQKVKSLGASATKTADNIKKSGNSMEALKKVGGGAATAIKAIGTATIAAGTAVAAGFGAATKAGADFESQMSTVEAISGASTENMVILSEKAKEMGIKTQFSATEAGQAMEYMAMAGWKTEEMLNGVEGVMNLAAASGENLASVSDIVTDAMTAFGLSADQSTRFADVLAAASSNSNTNVRLMGETFKYVAPVAGAMKFSIEDTAVAIGLMANAGIKSSQAGTALRSTLSRLAKPPKEAAEAMQALHLNVVKSDGSFKDFNQILVEMREKFGKLSDSQKTMYANMLGGREAMSGLLAIVNASDDDFNKLTEAINSSAGSAEKMANVRLDNMQGQITLLKSSLEGLGIAVYESNNAALTGAVEQAKEYVNQLTEAFNNGGFSGIVEQAGAVVADMAVKIAEQAPTLVNAAKNMLLSFANAIIANTPALANSAINIVTTLVDAIIALAPSFLETGLTLIVSLAQGLADSLPELIPCAIDMILELVDTFLDNLDSIVDAGINLVMALADGIVESIPLIVEKVPQIIAKLVDAIIRNAPKMALIAPKLYLELGKGLILYIGTALTQIPSLVAQIVEHFKTAFVTIQTVGKDIVEGLWNGIKNAKTWLLGKIKEWCGSILAGAKAFFKIHSPSVVMRDEVGRMLALGMADGITDGKGDILTAITSVGDSLIGFTEKYNTRLAEINAESAAEEAEKEEKEYREKLAKAKTAADKEKILAEKQAKEKKNLRQAELEELKKQTEAEKEQRDKAFETLDRASNLEIISQKEYYDTLAQLRDKYFEKGSSDWWKYTEKIIKYGKEQIKELKDYATTYSKDISEALKNYTTERDGLINPFAEKLSSADIYDTMKIISGDDENGSKTVELHKLKNWKEDIERLNVFDERISQVTDRMQKAFGDNDVALNEFLEMIRNDPFGEGEKILSIIEKESEENVFDFVKGWSEYKNKAMSISKKNHKGQLEKLENNLYDQLRTLQSNFFDKVSDITSGIPDDFKNWGEVSAEMFSAGFLGGLSEMLTGVGETLSSAFGKVVLRSAGSYNSIDNSKTNNINVSVSGGAAGLNERAIGRAISNILWLGSAL